MTRFIVDFELAGHVEVEAEDEEEAAGKVSEMSFEHLTEKVEIFNVGKNYVELLES
tara:strand:+ start:144 stop:311 length:168 start_codon:yes stop_codon:yes gene_type:complete